MSPRHSKHDANRHKFKSAEVEVVAAETIPPMASAGISPAHADARTFESRLEEAFPSGFHIDQNTEGQIRLLKTQTTLQKSSKKTTAPPPQDVRLGKDYEVLALLGEGGMGYVYKVKDKRKNQVVAVKVVRPELAADPRALKRFEQEAEAAMGLIHPNLVPVYGQGVTADGAPYLVMEYQEGTPLDKLLKQETKIEADRCLDIFMQICAALEHAHGKGIVHRDLKPSNIVLTAAKGNKDVVRIVDFGIAKLLASPESRESVDLTNTGDLFGSPGYMSPEQCMGYQLDARSDIYSLGCVMYELLSGMPPFQSDNPVQTIVKHLSESPDRLNKPGGLSIPANLEALVLRCLEKDPRNRYQTMEQLRKDLSSIQIGERPIFAEPREIAGRQLPVALKLSVVLLINALCLSTAFQQHEQIVRMNSDIDAISYQSENIDRQFTQALECLRGLGSTHSPIFAKQFNNLCEYMPSTVERLRRYRQNDAAFQEALQTVDNRLQEGLSVLAKNRLQVDRAQNNESATRSKPKLGNKTNAGTEDGDTLDQLENRIRESFVFGTDNKPKVDRAQYNSPQELAYDDKAISSYARLHSAITEMNWQASKSLINNSASASRNWLILEVLSLLLANVLLVPRFVKSAKKNSKKSIWQDQKS